MNALEALNRAGFLLLNSRDGKPEWLMDLAWAIAEWSIYLLPALLAGFWWWGDDARRSVAIKALIVVVASLAIDQLIRALWPHPRPFVVGLGRAWMPHAADASFPSDHMTVFAGIAVCLLSGRAIAWGLVVSVAALLVAWARIFLGVHFPLDMLGAVAVSAGVCAALTPWWRARAQAICARITRRYRSVFAYPIARGWVRP